MHTALSLAAAIFICLPSLLAQNIRAVDGYYSDPHPAAGRGIGEDIPSKKLPDEFEIHSRTPEISRDTEETISLVEDVLRERILSSSDDLISSGFQTSEDEGAVYYSAASSEDSLVLPASQEVHEREYARRLEAGIEPSDDEARDLQTPPTEKLHRARQVTAATAAPARRGPHPSSPCPSIFSYEGTKVGRQRWYGVILITTTETLTGVRLEVVLDKRANLLGAWLGEVSSVDNIHYTIWNGRRKVEPGPPLSVKIFVNYNENEPTPPKLKAIRLNGREICAKNNAARPVGANGRPTNSAAVSRPKPVNTRPSAVARPSTTARPLSTIRTPSRPIAPVRPATKPTQNNPGAQSSESTEYVDGVACGKVDAQAAPLITHGQKTARGQWPWHAAIYKSRGADLTYICGGSLIGKKIVLTAAHCVSHSHIDRPVSADELVVYLGKYHLKLWSEGGVQDKQVYEVHMHPEYNSTDFHADIAILVLSSPVDFSMYVKPICLWDKNRVQLREVEGKEGVVVGWGYNENGLLTEDLMMAKMPVVSQQTCIWSYPQFFSHFTSDRTFCAGFRNGTSVCNGDSGGGMVFPKKEPRSGQQVTWALRGIVSLSTSLENQKVCNTKHYVVFTDVVKFYDWIQKYR